MISSDFNNVMEKIRVYLQDKRNKKIYDKDIAAALGFSKEYYSRSKKENNVPLQPIINFCAKENIVINYILFDQMPESLNQTTDKIITVKYFKHINSSAGGGAYNETEEYEYLGIDEDIVNELGGYERLKYIEALNVTGESMEPLIKDNSIIFIDKSQINISYEKKDIFVVNTPSGVLVKWTTFIPNYDKVQLLSENRLYTPEVFDCDDVIIIGKVVGVSQGQ